MPGRLHKAGALEPIGQIGERLVLLDSSGPVSEQGAGDPTWFEVVFVEPIFGLGQKGCVLLWTQAGAAPAGYALPSSGAASGTITANGQVTAQPSVFNMGTHQLLHFRWLLRVIGSSGIVIDDLDVQVQLPAAQQRFAAFNTPSTWTARWQLLEASDTALGPAQGANQTNPSSPVSLSAPDWTNLNELFLYEQDNQIQFTIINRGSGSLSTSGTAIGLDVFGFRYDLQPIATADPDWRPRWLLGRQRMCPPDYVVVPIAGRAPGQRIST